MTARRKARQLPKSSREWVEHFRANEKPEALPREGPRLSEAEREAVVASVQEFQLGESSEGRHLHRALFFGARLVVWRNHGKAVRRGGLDFRSYWRRCWEEFEAAAEMMDPQSYAPSAHGQGSLSSRRVPDDGPDL